MPPYPRKRTRPLGLFVLVIGAGILAFSPRSRASRALWVPRVNQRAVVNLKKCPPCDLLFSKLEPTPNEKRFQIVQIQVKLSLFRAFFLSVSCCESHVYIGCFLESKSDRQ